MSKQQKSIPTIYHELPTSATRTTICVMEDLNGNFSLHNNRSALEKLQSFSALIKDTIQKIWDGFDAFTRENKQTILAYHANLFGAEPPKNQDIVITALYTWNKIIKAAKTDMTTEVPVSATGRKSTIGLCEYTLGPTEGDGQLKTPQAKACLKLFRQCLTERSANKDKPMITEEVLKQFIVDHASELHTRQEPWRIFQYYRPELISQNLLHRK